LAALQQALRQPAGFASYGALRQWVQQIQHLETDDHTLYMIVARGSRPNERSRGLATQNNSEAIAEFRATCEEQLPAPFHGRRPARCMWLAKTKVASGY